MGVQSDQHNPSFHSFFVQLPQTQPDPDVNFEKGEVIYENKDFDSGVRLFGQLSAVGFGFTLVNVLQTLATGRAVYPIGEEFSDIRAEANIGAGWLDSYS
eukprot:CAMPEP_0168315000 /NCGR_PEP_ID=MMETSP0210-20121227/9871_1 /TAXON_ID=40633 /ORGANISM="Condylostoma magnum, Strain COL2" /LENGTH=99 /DNA_ID=CAMNT_0008285855 /DNA_START=403 /DNA_END=705 /DNA_ORIENTATION=+